MADERSPSTWITYALVAANVAMFGFELASGVHIFEPTPQQLLDVGASFPPYTLGGEWWRLAASMFIHIGLMHLALNMFCLWQGRIVELMYGPVAFLVVYLLAGFAGGIASLARGGLVVTAGASGAVFGVYGAFAAFLVVRRSVMPEAMWRGAARGIALFVVINLVFGIVTPGISLSAHVGGLVIGFVLGAALLVKGTGRRPRWARTLAVAVAGAAVIAGAALAVPQPVLRTPPIAAFARVEGRVVEAWREVLRRHAAGELEDARAVAAVERDVIAPWQAGCDELAAAEPSEAQRALFDALAEYCAARRASWETYVAGLRASGDERKQLLLRHRFQELEIRKIGQAVVDAQRQLGGD